MIVLDTNQLKTAAFPHGAVLGMLRKIVEIRDLTLAIPEMVAMEHIAHHQHDVEQALTAARKALSTIDKTFDQDLTARLSNLSGDEAAQKRRLALEIVFTVLPTPPGAAEEALKREANRRPPANQVWEIDGKSAKASGARDVSIWLTLLETAASTDDDVWFVTLDADFGNEDFHPVLRREAEQRLGTGADRLRLLPGGINQLLRELAEPAEAPENLEELLQGPTVARAVNIALMGGSLFFRLLPHLSAGTDGFYKSTGPLLKFQRVKRHKTYQVGDRTWVSAQLVWRAAKIYHRMQLDSPDALWAEEIDFAFETTVLMELEDSCARSAEVVSAGPLTTLATSEHADGPKESGVGWALLRPDPSEPTRLVKMHYNRSE